MKAQTLIISQSAGFYGMAILTTHHPFEVVKAAMAKLENLDGPMGEAGEDEVTVCFKNGKQEPPILIARPVPDSELHAPKPVLLFDTGAAEQDMRALNLLVEQLDRI